MTRRIDELAPDPVVCSGCTRDLAVSEHAWWCPERPYEGPEPDCDWASDAEADGAAADMVYGKEF